MIRASRRTMLLAAAGLPLAGSAGLARAELRGTDAPLLLFDPATAQGRRFADHARTAGLAALAIEGDRVRFIAPLLARRPQRIVGVTRHADRLLIGGMAAEAGYREHLSIRHAQGRCATTACDDWASAGAFLAGSADRWPEALAELAGGSGPPATARQTAPADAAGWILTLPA
jgi:hypothetical protein